jgi:exonuclease SbcC
MEQQKIMVSNLASSVARLERNLGSSRESLLARQLERDEKAQILEKEAEISADYAAWQVFDGEVQSWQEKADCYHDLRQQMRPHELTIAEDRSRLEQEQLGLEKQAQQVLQAKLGIPALRERIEHDRARLQEIEERVRELETAREQLQKAQGELDRLRGERELEERELRRLEMQEKRIQQLAQEASAVLANEAQAKNELAVLNSRLQTITSNQEQYLIAKAELDTLQGQQQPLRQEMARLKERIERLEESEFDSECPTCGQPLSKEHRQAVLSDLQQEGKRKGDQFRGNKERINELAEVSKTLHGAFGQKEQVERDLQTNQQRLAKAEARLSEIKQSKLDWESDGADNLADLRVRLADDSALKTLMAHILELQRTLESQAVLSSEQKELQAELSTNQAKAEETARQIEQWESEGQAQLEDVRQRLAEEQFALEARAKLAEIQAAIAAVEYDPKAHQAARVNRDKLAEAAAGYQELKQAEAAIGPLTSTIDELERRIADQEEDRSDLKQQLAAAEAQLQSLVDGSGDLAELEGAVSLLREEDISAVQAVSVARQKLAVLQDLEEQKAQLEEDKAALSTLIQRLKFLEKSCSRQGVQALLIEHALPEIEERANQLVERLTGGDMRIYFDTQRKLKTRDAMAETLDIRIEDKDGVRPYDNYSGGEQFRVNFAIRLALSQLLAHRAGARLQTLVIDEGFGSQDPQGRQRLVEAINTVREEFACILVITHIAELRDAFSTRIEVQKTNNGSTIQVI